MLKQRTISVMVGLALMLAVLGVGGIVADAAGFELTPQTQACGGASGSAGGGC
jgi:hypothetical protein